jgi:hypothetical protein
VLFVACVLIRPAGAQNGAQETIQAFGDPSAPTDKRVDDLVSRMTLEEKVLQMQHTAPVILRLGIPSYERGGVERYQAVRGKLHQQAEDAAAWRDKCVHYFRSFQQPVAPGLTGSTPAATTAFNQRSRR